MIYTLMHSIAFHERRVISVSAHFNTVDTSRLVPGSIIYYRLLPYEFPTHPEKEWCGRCLSVHIGMPNALDVVLVESLESGYAPDTEFVLVDQITRIE